MVVLALLTIRCQGFGSLKRFRILYEDHIPSDLRRNVGTVDFGQPSHIHIMTSVTFPPFLLVSRLSCVLTSRESSIHSSPTQSSSVRLADFSSSNSKSNASTKTSYSSDSKGGPHPQPPALGQYLPGGDMYRWQ